MMASLPNTRRVSKEDLPGSPAWVNNLISGMNAFFDAVYIALNGSLTFGENIQCQIKEMTFTTPANYSSGNFSPVSFTKTLKTRAQGCLLLNIQESDDTSAIIRDATTVSSWQEGNGTIIINNVTGLDNDTKYTAKFLVI